MPNLRHIFISGAQSTGKTTLINELERDEEMQKLGFETQKEIAREIIKENGISQDMLRDEKNLLWLNLKILEKEYERMLEVENLHHGKDDVIMVWDRGVIDPLTYISEYISKEEAKKASELPHVKTMLERSRDLRFSLHFVVAPQPKCFENDGVRYESGDFESLQQFHVTMTSLMRHHGMDYVEVTDLNCRRLFVKETLKQKWGILK